jgi:hypothetical protein
MFILLVACYVGLFLNQTIFPFVDLPNHLAEAAIYKLSDSSIFNDFYYVSEGIEPNSLHYILTGFFDDVEKGNKLYYALYAILLPLLTFLLIKRLGGNWEFALLSLLLVFNYNVSFGFAGFTLAIPIALSVFYLLCVSKPWSKMLLTFVLILLFFTHILGLLFCLFLIVVIAIASVIKSKRGKDAISQIWFAIPVLILLFIWYGHAFKGEQSTLSFLLDYYKKNYFQEFHLRSKIFVFDNFALAEGYRGVVIAFLFSLAIFLPLVLGLLSEKISYLRIRNFYHANEYACLFLFVCMVCCFCLPSELPGQGILYQRFSVLFLIAIIIVGSISFAKPLNNIHRLVLVVVVLLHGALWYDYLTEFDEENSSFNASLFNNVAKNKIMGGVIVDYKYRGRPVYIHFANYNIIWNHGIATTKVIDYRFGSIKRTASKEVLPEYQEWSGTIGLIPKEYENLDYLLLRGEPKNLAVNASRIAGDKIWHIITVK